MSVATDEEVALDINLTAELPCAGITWVHHDNTETHEPCNRPATWRATMRHCGLRHTFFCDPCHDRKVNLATICARCGERGIQVTWDRP